MSLVKVARLRDVPVGRVVVVDVQGEELAICNVDGEIHAIANVCTHDGGPLGQGYLVGDEIECPRHGARFSVRTGEVRSLPAVMPVPRYEARLVGDDIWVDLEA